ncbi:SMC-Scp complex subunit ScpB [Chitinimonas lacunae]|uniref:SMC-Scp complex subunit ScpB n=1 Tax=Chitinimonas lacunae TaxID=1963018 RepID=A0ABV8MPA8_9NEIS
MQPLIHDLRHIKTVLETALLVAQEPLSLHDLKRLFAEELKAELLNDLLQEIQDDWVGRGVELVRLASGWRFRARLEFQPYLDRLAPEKPPRYSRAVMETLAIIAYKGPLTRGEIEEIRGVAVSTNVVRTLEERNWIEVVAYRETPGRPGLYATTRQFLDDLGLKSKAELPPLTELGALAVPDLAGGDES